MFQNTDLSADQGTSTHKLGSQPSFGGKIFPVAKGNLYNHSGSEYNSRQGKGNRLR
jgi:hypothetical protein